MDVILAIANLIVFAMFIAVFIIVIKIWRLLKDIADSGALSGFREFQAKKQAKEMIEFAHITDPEKAVEIKSVLSSIPDDEEAAQLLNQLIDLEKNKTG